MTNKGLHILSRAGLYLFLAESLLIITSWLLSATRLEGVRSLLSSEGIRWFVGSFTMIAASPLLVWLVLSLIVLGCFQKSGAVSLFLRQSPVSYRDRIAFRVSFAFLIIYIAILCLLTLMPHAILLSATGSLFPSAFSRSLVPIVAFGVGLFSVAFGLMSGRFRSLSDILEGLSFGIRQGAPLFVVYILFMQFFHSLWFVFG